MTAQVTDPGSATLEELTAYWRMPSKRATRELARKLGLRRVRGNYPWFAIWQIERLALPSRRRWEELKRPHLTTADLGELLGESERSARRRDAAKPDASFPDPLPIRKKPKLWRSAQVHAWCSGLPVPVYQSSSKFLPTRKKAPPETNSKVPANVFDPFAQKRSAAK
ncbi:hypothetical protein [Roseovarius ramblicola]|uniref:Uncharacterized protein n=1 Tax=Roseovarius ramblicola TaxID=2022336 RepID=A0ABV5HXF9_9RHOB